MSLAPGAHLAHYEIVESIGAGGMGEVYRAKDSKLGRDVAIKVLPDAFARDEERLRRFQREAKVLASLNHPNIASIYGLEQSGETHYLVLELVPGETLAERIARGPIPVDEALAIAAEIAEALEEAHEHGIVHRDLKPANVKLTADGKIKVLDFGLAKAFVEDGQDGDAATSMSPTITRDATRVGVILGTAAYMSPEQAKGKQVDKRTDIFAFGALLYEMLSGKKAFPGEDVSEVLAAVIKSEPDWDELPKEVSSTQRAMLRRCLEKNRSGRWHDMGDISIFLEETEALGDVLGGPPRSMLPAAAAVILALVVLAGFLLRPVARPSPAAVQRFSISLPEGDHFGAPSGIGGSSLALSPSADTLVYVARRGGVQQLFERPLDRHEASPLAGTEGAIKPFFSPGGSSVGFFADGQLKTISLDTGRVTVLCAASRRPAGGVWSSNGNIFFSRGGDLGVFRIAATGGEPTQVALGDGNEEMAAVVPTLVPGTEVLVYQEALGDGHGGIVATNLENGHRAVLIPGRSSRFPVYVSSGHLLIQRVPSSVWAAPLDVDALELSAEPVPVLQDVANPVSISAELAVSENGTLVYLAASEAQFEATVPMWVDRDGRAEPVARVPARNFMNPRLSPDDERVLLSSFGPNQLHIWMLDVERGALSRFFENGARAFFSADGEMVVFGSARGQRGWNIYTRPSDASNPETQITFGGLGVPYSMSPDGRWVLQRAYGDAGDWDVALVALDGEVGEPEILLGGTSSETSAMISPDGGLVAYVSDESGQDEVYVRAFPELGAVTKISIDGGVEPLWRRDGRELFYRGRDHVMSVEISREPFQAGKPVPLFEDTYVREASRPWTNYDVNADGSRFLMLRSAEGASGPRELRVVLNWFEELERLVPTH